MFLSLLAQAQAVGTNPFAGLEEGINTSVAEAVNLIFNSQWYQAWVWLRIVLVTFLALNTFLFRWTVALLGRQGQNQGMFTRVLFNGLWVIIVFTLTLNPQIICEPVFSTWEFFNALADSLLYSAAGGAGTLFKQVPEIANAVSGASPIFGNAIAWTIAWVIAAIAMVVLVAIYYFHYISGLAYLYIVFPFFMGLALAGLMSKPTQGWFGSVLNTGLTQVLKPLLGKVFLWLTFAIMARALGFVANSDAGTGPVNTFFDRSALIIMVFLVTVIFGIILQLAVPAIAKLASVTASNGARDIVGAGLAGGAIALALGALRLTTRLPLKTKTKVTAGLGDNVSKLERLNRDRNAFDPKSLRNTEGFKKLSPQEQNKFLRYVGGTNEQVSGPARERLAKRIEKLDFDVTKPETYRQFLSDQPGTTPLGTPAETFDTRRGDRSSYWISGAEEIRNYKFAGGRAAAQRYSVNFDGQSIEVIVPKDLNQNNGYFVSQEQVGAALAAVPEPYRSGIKQIEINPAGSAGLENKLGGRAYLGVNTQEGNIRLYPTEKPVDQASLDGALIGGAGDLLAGREFDANPGTLEAYKSAIQNDLVAPSGMAQLSAQRDFSETVKLYEQVRGTPQEAEIRELFNERLSVIENLLDKNQR